MPQATSFPSQLSASDRVMWRIERDPLLRSVVVAVGLLDQEPDWKGARATFEHATERLPRLRQRIVSGGPGDAPHWADDPGFSLDYHIRRVAAPSPGDLRALLDLVAPIASCALDPARPLWECTVVDGLEGGRGAFVWKFHHTMTDGVGGMKLAGDVFDCARHGGPRVDAPTAPAAGTTSSAGPIERLLQSGLAGVRAMTQPGRVATDTARFSRSVARMLAPASEPLSPVLRGRSLDRRFDVLEVPLASMRASAKAVDGTINDVFLAGVGGGLHEFHSRLGYALPAVRVTMPINLRRDGDPPGGNRFTPVRFILPIDDPDPAFRARIAGAIARKWRAEPAVGLTSVLADLLDRLPPPVLARVFGAMLKNVDIGAVDVPGFREPAYLGGARVERIWGFSPPTGAALSITLLSHVDTCCIGVASDLAAVPDPDLLVSCFRDSFDEVTAIGTKSGIVRLESVMNGQRLGVVDETYLAIEAARTPLHVASLAIFEGGPLLDEDGKFRLHEVRARIEARLGLLPRLRQRIATVPFGIGRPVWVDDEHFDIANHVDVVTLGAPGDEEALLRLAEDLFMEPLDRSVPLWHFQFVTGLRDGRVALIERAHHAMVDGVSGVDVSLVLLDSAADTPPSEPEEWTPVAPPSAVSLVSEALRDRVVAPLSAAAQAAGSLLRPGDVARRTADIVSALRTAADGGILAPRTSLNVSIGSRRRLSLLRYRLADVKGAGSSAGATVNDVVLTAVAGGLRALFVARGETVPSTQSLRALVPVSLRDPTESIALGNRVGALLTPIPVGIGDPVERLSRVSATTKSLKASTEAQTTDVLLRAADVLPPCVAALIESTVHRQPLVNLVVTNVPGPRSPLYALGARMLEVYPLVPLGGNMSLEVAILSYDGTLAVGITSDPETCPDVDMFVEGMDQCFATLGACPERSSSLGAAVS